LLAGINAAAGILDLPALVLRRSDAYIGVLVDDLVRMSLVEPYRMFTSRAEFRLQLRVDNADERLMPVAERYGLLDEPLRRVRERNASQLAQLQAVLPRRVERTEAVRLAREAGASPGNGPYTVEKLLRTPGIGCASLAALVPEMRATHPQVLEKLEVRVRYAGYIRRQDNNIKSINKLEKWNLPSDLEYTEIFGLSSECVQKLRALRPRTLAQASRIDGVRAADLSLLLVHLERRRRAKSQQESSAQIVGT
jgi:tRNA uridine 5-carboxymethylaminomethyl modification enzyme